MPYSPCFRRVACCNLCVGQPRTKGYSWHRSIYMWKQYLHYRGHKISGRWGKKRHRKMKFFQGLPYNSPVFTKPVITLSFGVRFGPTSTQNARGERANPKKLPACARRPRVPSNSALSRTFWPLKLKENHSPLFFGQVYEPIGTSFWRKFEGLRWL